MAQISKKDKELYNTVLTDVHGLIRAYFKNSSTAFDAAIDKLREDLTEEEPEDEQI